jgi:hypothetical protein
LHRYFCRKTLIEKTILRVRGATACHFPPFIEGFRTPATVQAASLRSAGIRNPQQKQTFVLYAMRVSKKKSASGLTIEFIATCSEFTCSPCRLTYSYAACSRFQVWIDEFTSIREGR